MRRGETCQSFWKSRGELSGMSWSGDTGKQLVSERRVVNYQGFSETLIWSLSLERRFSRWWSPLQRIHSQRKKRQNDCISAFLYRESRLKNSSVGSWPKGVILWKEVKPNEKPFEVRCQAESIRFPSPWRGMVGNRSAFATAALVSTTALAMTLLFAPDADAGTCGGNPCDKTYCCLNINGGYSCTNTKLGDGNGFWSCRFA